MVGLQIHGHVSIKHRNIGIMKTFFPHIGYIGKIKKIFHILDFNIRL